MQTGRGMVHGQPADEREDGQAAGRREIASRRATGGGRAARPAVRGAAGNGVLVSRKGARGMAATRRRRGATREPRGGRTQLAVVAAARPKPASTMPSGVTPHVVAVTGKEDAARGVRGSGCTGRRRPAGRRPDSHRRQSPTRKKPAGHKRRRRAVLKWHTAIEEVAGRPEVVSGEEGVCRLPEAIPGKEKAGGPI